MFLISKCRGDWVLDLCTTSVLALREPRHHGKIRFFLRRNTFFPRIFPSRISSQTSTEVVHKPRSQTRLSPEFAKSQRPSRWFSSNYPRVAWAASTPSHLLHASSVPNLHGSPSRCFDGGGNFSCSYVFNLQRCISGDMVRNHNCSLIWFKWHIGKEPKRTLLSKTKEPFEDFIQMAYATRNTTICHEKLEFLDG